MTFKWRFSSSSRYGMMTCVPAFAVCVGHQDTFPLLFQKNTHTELGDEITAEEACAAKDGRNVPCYRTTPSRTLRDDRRPTGERE